MKLGSLFDGIGGFPLVGTWYGIEPVWASEIESAPVSITSRHFPNMKHLGDITKINGSEIEPVDIITFGSPCQDLSVAGKRAGMAGARSGLFGEAIRIIEEMRDATNGLYPTWAIWENVPGALSSNDGLDFRAVLQSFADTEIPMPSSGRWGDSGMVRGGRCDFGWRTLDAQFWGVPQRRKRIFLVADFRGQRAAEVLFKPESLRGHFAPSGTQRERTTADVERSLVYPSITPTLDTCTDKTKQFVYDCRGNGDGTTVNTLTGDHQNRVTDYTAIVLNDQGGNIMSVSENVVGTLRAEMHGNIPAVAVFAAGNGAGAGISYSENIAPTLKAAGSPINQAPTIAVYGEGGLADYIEGRVSTLKASGGVLGGGSETFVRDKAVRRLTPVECERLQGYPDNWTKYGHDGKEISDSARYKACGNSLALPCVEYLIAGIAAQAAPESTEYAQAEGGLYENKSLYHS